MPRGVERTAVSGCADDDVGAVGGDAVDPLIDPGKTCGEDRSVSGNGEVLP